MSNEADADRVKPSEQRGGTTPGEAEAREKGGWAATAAEGVVPDLKDAAAAPRQVDKG